MSTLRPFYEKVQQIYDGDELTQLAPLFLDSRMLYTCAYYEREDMSLEEAQLAKLDLALGKCELRPGMRLLEIGCGWGAGIVRAIETYDVTCIGLTLSRQQQEYALAKLRELPAGLERAEIRLQGWEEFFEPVDRIFSIGAFEHFRAERHAEFFRHCRSLLPADGRMLLHTITWPDAEEFARAGRVVEHEQVLFAKFIRREIFPGGMLSDPATIIRHATAAGFSVTRTHSLRPHYARTLDTWSANLVAHRQEAITRTSLESYERFQKYFTGCAKLFRSGHIDVIQFSLACA